MLDTAGRVEGGETMREIMREGVSLVVCLTQVDRYDMTPMPRQILWRWLTPTASIGTTPPREHVVSSCNWCPARMIRANVGARIAKTWDRAARSPRAKRWR